MKVGIVDQSTTLRVARTLVLATCMAIYSLPSSGQDRTAECNAVLNKATITLSGKLVLGISESPTDKTCHFIVSLPPPHSIKAVGLDAWFKFTSKDALNESFANKVLFDLSFAITPENSLRHIKEIESQIFKNSKLTSSCFSALFERKAIDNKSPDGQFSCSVPPSADYATFQMNAGAALRNTIILPRPS